MLHYLIPVLIIFAVSVSGLLIYTIICQCGCKCLRQGRHRSDYEELFEIESSNEITESGKSFDQSDCQICLEEMKIKTSLFRAPCRHKFHKKCLAQWLREGNRCPLCNSSLQPSNARMQSTAVVEKSINYAL